MIRDNLRACATQPKPKNRLGRGFLVWLLLTVNQAVAAPHALSKPEFALYVPSMSALSTLEPALRRAGEHASLLRPQAWSPELHPFLNFNLFAPDALSAQGVDVKGSFTLSRRKDLSLSCVGLTSLTAFEAAARPQLSTLGTLWKKKVAGLSRQGAKDVLGRDLAGFVTDGKTACAVQGQGGVVEQDFVDAARALKTNASGGGFALAGAVKGALFFVAPSGVVAVSANSGDALLFEGAAVNVPSATWVASPSHPFGAGAPRDALASTVGTVAEADLPRVLTSLEPALRGTLSADAAKAFHQALATLGPSLSGQVAFGATRLEPSGPLRTRAGQFFAVRMVAFANVKDVALARTVLGTLAQSTNAKSAGEGFELQVAAGKLFFGLDGTRAYFANDAAALAVLRKAPFTTAPVNAGLRGRVRLGLVAEGLSRIPLLEAVTAPELAGLLAAATELGPLLEHSDDLAFDVDTPAPGSLRFRARWNFKSAAVPVLDGGS